MKNKTMKQEIFIALRDALAKLPGRLVTFVAVTLVAGGSLWAMAAFTEPTSGPASSVQDFAKNVLGANNGNNAFDSSAVAANQDGSILERLEYVQGVVSCGETISDADGNTYGTVLIGSQCWQASNMRATKYPGGASIARGPATATWNGNDNAYYAYPPNVGNAAEESAGFNNVGYVYQWSAAMNGSTAEGAQGICPNGWHIPSDAEWNALEAYLADGTDSCGSSRQAWSCSAAGTSLKAAGSAKFQGPLSGFRTAAGGFNSRGSSAYFWSATQSGSSAWYRSLNSANATVLRDTFSKSVGLSVRCVKG
jgi:uncharacterized protein (TIGR02145 family)